jgi:uncharacterized repeat protein (TIGR01451 family)
VEKAMTERIRAVLLVILLPGLASTARAQGPEPLLYVRLTGPEGMRVTFYRGSQGETVATPAVVGLRPGYIYRVKISDLPQFPAQAFYPTLEVRGSLRPERRVKPADFPATLALTAVDFDDVAVRQVLLTKVIVLERPDLAIPIATVPERPIELPVAVTGDPVEEGRTHGRVLLVMRLGQREMDEKELAVQGLRGTVLLPGEKNLSTPVVPPWLSWQCWPVLYDPVHGQEPASAEMCVPDGGDSGMPAGFGADGRLRGLDPSDTLAEYEDSRGRRRIAVSNQVCVCVPRFLVLRGETRPAGRFAVAGPGVALALEGGLILQARQQLVAQEQSERLVSANSRQRASGAFSSIGPAIFGQMEGLDIVGVVRGLASINGSCKAEAEPPPDKPLELDKFPDKCATLAGDTVMFTLRYRNRGGQPITNVIVSDSLAGRYEYVPGSQQTDRPANFTTQPNEAGSLILRWQITEPLPPSQTGTITFQVRVR